MNEDDKPTKLPALPPERRSIRRAPTAARRNDLIRRSVVAALRASGRYEVITNLKVPVTRDARDTVRRAAGGYVGISLPADGPCEEITVDMVVVDENEAWAGAYAFCRRGAQSPLARRRVEEDLRAAELVLRAHLARLLRLDFRTVVVGIIDQSADPEHVDDLTIPASEISDHFEIDFPDPGEMYRTCPGSGA
jgi:hypothetical protein